MDIHYREFYPNITKYLENTANFFHALRKTWRSCNESRNQQCLSGMGQALTSTFPPKNVYEDHWTDGTGLIYCSMSVFDKIGSGISWLYCQMNIVSPNKDMKAGLIFSARGTKSTTRTKHPFCHNNKRK